ncbi:unnamed protein product [Amoebophrya sp. A25]|nr:unnamed protein product [Amoebophrya sp. A25]|eukprot:GSA25T00010988001.1
MTTPTRLVCSLGGRALFLLAQHSLLWFLPCCEISAVATERNFLKRNGGATKRTSTSVQKQGEIFGVKRDQSCDDDASNSFIDAHHGFLQQQHITTGLGQQQHTADKVQPQCAFDDALFRLSAEDKETLLAEISGMRPDVDFVQTGGSHVCATWGQPCTCSGGYVIFGVPHLGLWSPAQAVPEVADNAVGGTGSLTCGAGMGLSAQFLAQVEPFSALSECHCYGQAPASFHLQRRLNSVSTLQEAWIFLLRLLNRRKLLPLGTRDSLYHGLENWSKRSTEVGSVPRVPEHYYVNRYMVALRHMPQLFQVRRPPALVETRKTAGHSERRESIRCGEWAELNYIHLFRNVCEENIAFRYEPTLQGVPPHLDLVSHTLYGDILDYPRLLRESGGQPLDLIIATQVWEHLPQPQEAAKALFHSLQSGGLVFFSVPQLAQYHQVPGDYFRYTKEGVHLLFSAAGFCVPKTLMASGGDYIWDIARDAGLQTADFTMDEMDAAFKWGYDQISDGASTIFAVAIKPPHPHPECSLVVP